MLNTLCARDPLRMCAGDLRDVIDDIYIVVHDLSRILLLLYSNIRRLTDDILEISFVNYLELTVVLLSIVGNVLSLAISWGVWFVAHWVKSSTFI